MHNPEYDLENNTHKMIWDFDGLVWFLGFNGISTLCKLFNVNVILVEEQ